MIEWVKIVYLLTRFIHSKNRAALGFSLAVNHLADKTQEEIRLMNGYRYSPGPHGGLAFDTSKYSLRDLPDSLDWRLHGEDWMGLRIEWD